MVQRTPAQPFAKTARPQHKSALDLGGALGHTETEQNEVRTMGILNGALRAVTWWNNQTWGTQLYTWRKGQKVGEDNQGNVFYQTADGKKRWVIFNGEAEASRIDPEWHGWLHHTWSEPPTKSPLPHKDWEKPHQENLTGTPAAYTPPGSIRRPDPVARADYEAWQPE